MKMGRNWAPPTSSAAFLRALVQGWSSLLKGEMALPIQGASGKKHDGLIIAVSLAVVAGMLLAAVCLAWWRYHPSMLSASAAMRLAVILCPPFMLLREVGGVEDSVLSLAMTEGAIVVANGSLYAGLAAFGYWALTTFRRSEVS